MRYMLALAGGGSTDWNSSAPELPPTALDHELAQWLAHGKVLVKQYRLELKDSPVEERPLGDADAYAARGLLRYLQAWQAPLPAEIAQAIAADPVDVIARMIQANHDRAITLELAQQIETAHPADWRAWWLVAHATPPGPHTLEARQRMCELIATTPVMLPRGVCP